MKKILLSVVLVLGSLQANSFSLQELLDANLKTYTDEEKAAIQKDLAVVRDVCFPQHPQSKERPRFVATAGSPGSRKTTILEKFLKNNPEYSDCIYLDADPRALKYMVHTYISRSVSPLIASETHDYGKVIKNAYDKWRYGATYICAALLEEAFQNRYDIAFGTTMTGEDVPRRLKVLKDGGYEITLLLCSSEDDFRVKSITYRNEVQRFYQSSPEDALTKGKFFPQRMPIYFTYADKMHFFWSDNLETPERLAASYENGKLTVHDEDAWYCFAQKYEKDRQVLISEGKQLPSWDEILRHLP